MVYDDSGESYLAIQAARNMGTVQWKLINVTYMLIPDFPVTRICPLQMMSAIHCIVWYFFSLKTFL